MSDFCYSKDCACGNGDSSGNDENKRTVLLKFYRAQLLYDIKNYAYIEGHVMGEEKQHAQHVDQQIVGVNELSSVFIGQETADDSTEGCPQTVGTDEIQPSQMHFGKSQILLPEGESAGSCHDGSCIEIIGERHGNRALQTSFIVCHNDE